MLFPQPLTHYSLVEELSIYFLQKTTELLIKIFNYVGSSIWCETKHWFFWFYMWTITSIEKF